MRLSPKWGGHGISPGQLGSTTKMLAGWKQKAKWLPESSRPRRKSGSGWPGRSDRPAQSLANLVLRTEICERLLAQDIDEALKELGSSRRRPRQSD